MDFGVKKTRELVRKNKYRLAIIHQFNGIESQKIPRFMGLLITKMG